MNIYYDCLTCTLKSFIKKLEKYNYPKQKTDKCIREFLSYLSKVDFKLTPPELGREMHNAIKKILCEDDPYKKEKAFFHNLMMERYDEFKDFVKNSKDPFNTAIKLSVLGNTIDFGSEHGIDFNNMFDRISDLKFKIDHSEYLKDKLSKSENILFLGDNCGEDVLDKLFIETILEIYGNKHINFAVRSKPAINDITYKDALEIKLDEICTIIENGYDAPGTILKECSKEFLDVYNSADLVISKGQGNYESLSDEKRSIYFLLIVKCNIVANHLSVSKADTIVYNNTRKYL